MARSLHPLKRTAKGSSTIRKKKARRCPQLESLVIEVKCNVLHCSILGIRRKYSDKAIEVLKTGLNEKLVAEKVEVIKDLRIATPGHHSELLNLFSTLSIHIIRLEVETTIETLETDDCVETALATDNLDSITLFICDMTREKTELIKNIIERCLTVRKARVYLTEKDTFHNLLGAYIDANLFTDEYLLKVVERAKQEIELGFVSSLLSVDGILAAAEAIAKRNDPVKLCFQLKDNHRFKKEILERWGIQEFVSREFREENDPRTVPIVCKNFTMFNEGCTHLCIFDGQVMLKMPTDFHLEERLDCLQRVPFRLTIERILDKDALLASHSGFFEVKHK